MVGEPVSRSFPPPFEVSVPKRSAGDRPDAIASKRLRTMWESGNFCDSAVRCQDRTWRVHRAVLGAASPVLARMLESGMVESTEPCEVVLRGDADPGAVAELLEFAYTGQAPCLQSIFAARGAEAADSREEEGRALALLELAAMYQMPDLVRVCSVKLLATKGGTDRAILPLVRALRAYRQDPGFEEVQRALHRLVSSNSKAFEALCDGV